MLALKTPPHYQIIDAAPLQPSTKGKYKREVDRMIEAQIDPRNLAALAAYALTLSGSSRSFLKAALALLFEKTGDTLKASATPDNLATVQAALLNLEAMSKAIETQKPKGIKVHVWLSQEQVDQITAAPWNQKDRTHAYRDYIVLAVMLGAGLRREELSELTFDCIKRLPNRTSYRDVIEVTGKGGKVRIVPISPTLSARIAEWRGITGGGHIARSINKAGKLGDSLSTQGIADIVTTYGNLIGVPDLDPHDCRRSFGRLGWEATRDLILIRDLLGHADAKTTQSYIGLHLQLDVTASDFIIRGDEFTAKVSGD
jgi:site-specific recombinase XerC